MFFSNNFLHSGNGGNIFQRFFPMILFSVAVNAQLEYWIGLSWDAEISAFVWSDGEQFDFTDLMPNNAEPNFSGDCVRISKLNKWRDHRCSMVYNFVCKREGTVFLYYSFRDAAL